jgi:glutamate transport system permease protein
MLETLSNYDVAAAVWVTIQLSVLSAMGALIIGTIVAVLRVSPVAVLRGIGTSYVNIFRNTPLTVLLTLCVLGLSLLVGLQLSQDLSKDAFRWAVVGLSAYHAAFVCEAIRSGVNTVPAGQAEAARSIGLTFAQSLREVLLPQAFRGSIAPLGSVAAVVGVADTAKLLATITENEGAQLGVFFVIAMIFVVLTLPIGVLATSLSQRLAVRR